MAYLTINTIEVPVADAEEQAPTRIGTSRRMFAGNLRSTVRMAKRTFQFQTAPMQIAEYTAFRNNFIDSTFYPCGGEAFGESGGVFYFQYGGIEHTPEDEAEFRRTVTFTLTEA